MTGGWREGWNWSTNPHFPDNGNPAAATYDAIIAATGPENYTVYLHEPDASVTVNTLNHTSHRAHLLHNRGTLTFAGGASPWEPPLRLSGGARYTLEGGTISFASQNGISQIGADGAGTFNFRRGNVVQTGPVVVGIGGGSLGTGTGRLDIGDVAQWQLASGNFPFMHTAAGVGPGAVGTIAFNGGLARFLDLSVGANGGRGTLSISGFGDAKVTATRLEVGSGPWLIEGTGTAGFGTVILDSATSRLDLVPSPNGAVPGVLRIGGPNNEQGHGVVRVLAGTLIAPILIMTDHGLLDATGGRVELDRSTQMSGEIRIGGNTRIGIPGSLLTLTHGGQLNMSGGSLTLGQLQMASGTQTFTASGGSLSIGSFSQSSGESTFAGSASLLANELAIGGNAQFRLNGATINVPSIVVAGGAFDYSAGALNTAALSITGGQFTLTPGADVNLVLSSLQVQDAGTLDIGDNRVTIGYSGESPIEHIRAGVARAYADRSWTGTGITSSLASHSLAVGYADFGGASVILRLARFGDADLDGVVNLADFNRLAANFGSSDAFWHQGDFNYDGVVNLADFNRLAANFGLAATGPEVTPEDWANLANVVPEPAGAGLALLAAAGVLRRRRRAAG